MSRRRGHVLMWQAALIRHLAKAQPPPPNQLRIVAVGAALVSHADPDGTRCRPGIRLLARETGQYVGRVSEAVNWLIDEGWLTLERRVDRGGREFRLTFPQRSGDSNADESTQRSGDSNADPTASFTGTTSSVPPATTLNGSVSGQRSGDNNEPPRPSANARGYDEEFEEWARERAAAKGGGPGLVKTILREDRHIFEDARARAVAADSLTACLRCHGTGIYWIRDDGTPTTGDDPAGEAMVCQHAKQPTH